MAPKLSADMTPKLSADMAPKSNYIAGTLGPQPMLGWHLDKPLSCMLEIFRILTHKVMVFELFLLKNYGMDFQFSEKIRMKKFLCVKEVHCLACLGGEKNRF